MHGPLLHHIHTLKWCHVCHPNTIKISDHSVALNHSQKTLICLPSRCIWRGTTCLCAPLLFYSHSPWWRHARSPLPLFFFQRMCSSASLSSGFTGLIRVSHEHREKWMKAFDHNTRKRCKQLLSEWFLQNAQAELLELLLSYHWLSNCCFVTVPTLLSCCCCQKNPHAARMHLFVTLLKLRGIPEYLGA